MARKDRFAQRLQDIGWNIKAVRTLRDLTQAQLAERCGLSREWVYRIEGGADTTASKLLVMAEALDVPVEYFWMQPKPEDRLEFFAEKLGVP